MPLLAAKIAVSAAIYRIDRPYEYRVPEELRDRAVPGARVFVPFSAGNRKSEGIILALTDSPSCPPEKLKSILSVPDEKPILTPVQLQLALFIRERYFCTVYDAVRTMLPAGMWFGENGRQRVSDKILEMARLLVSSEEASELAGKLSGRARARAALLRELAVYGELPVRDLLIFAGTNRAPLNALKEQGIVELYGREVFRSPRFTAGERKSVPVLNSDQEKVYSGLKELADSSGHHVALLQGVTGSGKTSVYIRLISHVLEQGKNAILLVPEIALTPQMLQIFSSYFGDDIAVLHSSLSSGERFDEWKRLKAGKAHLAIGTRSAVFAPVEAPGIIIIDEEQEDTYRSENNPRYDAREVARFIAYKAGCLLLLGSATPDVCSRYAAESGEYSFFRLDRRYNRLQLPEVKIVDMKSELRAGNDGCISSFLRDELQENIDRGEQSILFLNRRGSRKLVACGECGYEYKCPNCSVALTYHSMGGKLICHYCGHTERPAAKCPECGGILKYIGIGTQLVEEELHVLFPENEVIRMDADTLSASVTHETILERFRRENIPVMIGTQMVTKGLDFENVTLIGVILADQSLNICSIRAPERTFSLITQVIGRSGRGSKPGRAVIQTYSPQNDIILQSSAQDYDSFYESEIALRRVQEAPPFADMFSVCVFGENEKTVTEECMFIRARLRELLSGSAAFTLMGPAPLPVIKVNNMYRYRIILKCRADNRIRSSVSRVICECGQEKRFKGTTVFAETDPDL